MGRVVELLVFGCLVAAVIIYLAKTWRDRQRRDNDQ